MSSEAYTFSTLSDDGVRLWVDGQLLVDNWTVHGSTLDVAAPITLQAGQKYDLRLEYFDGNGEAQIHLSWSTPTMITWQAVPTSQLYLPPAGATTTVTSLGRCRVLAESDESKMNRSSVSTSARIRKSLLIGNRAQKLLDFANLYRGQFRAGLTGLETKPGTPEEAKQQFEIKRHAVEALVTRVEVQPDRTLRVTFVLDPGQMQNPQVGW